MTGDARQERTEIRLAAHEWRLRLSLPATTDKDRQDFAAWLTADPRHEDAYDLAVTYWEAMGAVDREDLDRRIFWPGWRFRAAKFAERVVSLIRNAGFQKAFGAAVLATIAFAFYVLSYVRLERVGNDPLIIQHKSAIGETLKVMLADGTAVTLGPATTIHVALSENAREVGFVSGAAMFDVATDTARPFSVRTGDLTATALGTSFDVRHNGGIARVGVAEGRVRVRYSHTIDDTQLRLSSNRELQAGEQVAATPEDGLGVVERIKPDAVGAWREQRLIYANATLRELVADANRYSDRQIDLVDPAGAISGMEVTISVDARDVEQLLMSFPDMFPVSVDDRGDSGILIRPRRAAE